MAVKREYLYAVPLSKAQNNAKDLQRRLVRMADERDTSSNQRYIM